MKNPGFNATRWIRNAAVLGLLGWLAYSVWGFSTAEERLRGVCQRLTPGMSMEALRDFAAQHGLNAPHSPSGTSFMVERRSFGRYGCELELADGRLVRAQYHFAD